MEQRQREIREQNWFNNRVMHLDDVKEILINDSRHKGIELSYKYFMSHPSLLHKHEKYINYLHFLIMFSSPSNVNSLLKEHEDFYGEYATKLLINYPFICSISKNIITPLMCAAMWSDDPQMIRTLAFWGADFSQMDINGKYAEEKYATYYVNHLNHILAPNYFTIGLRIGKEFLETVREIKILCGHIEKPVGWSHPGNAYRQRSSLGRSVLSSSPPLSRSSGSGLRGSLFTNTIAEESTPNQFSQHP